MAMDGNEPFWLFLGVVAILAAFALVRGARRRSRPGAPRWGRDGGDAKREKPARAGQSVRWENDSSRGPGSTDSGASDGGGKA
jgi:hypothetical protein